MSKIKLPLPPANGKVTDKNGLLWIADQTSESPFNWAQSGCPKCSRREASPLAWHVLISRMGPLDTVEDEVVVP